MKRATPLAVLSRQLLLAGPSSLCPGSAWRSVDLHRRSFVHVTEPMLKRRGGVSALLAKVTGPSKKQLRRRREKLKAQPPKVALKPSWMTSELAVVEETKESAGPEESRLEGKIDRVFSYLMESSAEDILGDFQTRPEAFQFTKADVLQMEEELKKGIRRRNLESLLQLLRMQLELDMETDAWKTVRSIETSKYMEPGEEVYARILRYYAWKGNIDKSLEVVARAEGQGVEAGDVMNSLMMHCYVRANRLDKAFQLINALMEQGARPGVRVFNPLIDGCIERGKIDMAWKLYEQMRKEYAEPDLQLYTTMMKACAKTNMVERANNLMEEMQQKGIEPDRKTFLTMMTACARSTGYQKLTTVWHQRMKVAGYEPDTVSYNILLQSCVQTGDVESAVKTFMKMRDEGHEPEEHTFSSLLNTYAKALSAHKWLGKKKDAGVSLIKETEYLPVVLNDPRDTLERYERTKNAPLRSTEFQSRRSSKGLFHDDDDEELERLEEELEGLAERDPDEEEHEERSKEVRTKELLEREALDVVLDVYGRRGLHKAEELVHRATAEAKRISDALVFSPNVEETKEELKERLLDEAEAIFADLQESDVPVSSASLNSFLNVFAEAVEIDKAKAVLSLFDEHDIEPTIHTFRSLMKMYIRAGKGGIAKDLLLSLAKNGPIEPDADMFGLMVDACAKAGRFDDSFKLLQMMKDQGLEVKEKHVKRLRARCEDRGIKNDLIPEDPNRWKFMERQHWMKKKSKRIVTTVNIVRSRVPK